MAAKDLYEKDYYAILGVDKKADAATIKKKYRQLARELHPDKTKGDKKLEDRFKEVSEAYDILGDDKKRSEYDQAREMFQSGAFRQGAHQFSGDFSDLFENSAISKVRSLFHFEIPFSVKKQISGSPAKVMLHKQSRSESQPVLAMAERYE